MTHLRLIQPPVFFSSGPAVCCSWKGKLLHFVYESLASRLNSHSSTNSCIVHSHQNIILYWTVSLYSTVAILGESGCGRNRAAMRIGRAQGNYKKRGRALCERNLGARPQKFYAPEACSGGGGSEAPFRACTQYIHICKLPSSIGGSDRKKVRQYGTVASELRSNHVKGVHYF